LLKNQAIFCTKLR